VAWSRDRSKGIAVEPFLAGFGKPMPPRGNVALTRKIHAALDKSVRAAVRRFPFEAQILNVAGYHQKNAYMLNHWDAIQAGRAPPDPLLQKSEHCFFASLQANPLDPRR
jgi:hypothetical protein